MNPGLARRRQPAYRAHGSPPGRTEVQIDLEIRTAVSGRTGMPGDQPWRARRRANDETARVAEVRHAQEQTQAAEARNDTGIYVYALPHYLRYPFEPDSGRTLMKVGRSDRDIIHRFRSQTRTTALPEEPILLRIYRTDGASAALTETYFHRLLDAVDHNRSVTRSAGREWFVTSTRFLSLIHI